MAKHKTDWYPDPIPGFDALKTKWDIQTQIYEETKHMTPEEQREHTRKSAERFDAEMKRLRAERLAAESQT